jgi:isochorismate pyruvate lyase
MTSKQPEQCKNLQEIRLEIDRIDHEIIRLIAERSGYVKAASAFKKSETAVRDDKRVFEVIESKKQLAAEYGISAELIGEIYERLIRHFVNQELNEWKTNQQQS